MNKLEEAFSKQLVIIDGFEVKMNHLVVFVFILFISAIYSFYLIILCSTEPWVLSGLLLFGSQIAIGFPAIRAFYDLGVSNKEKIQFIDPAMSKINGLASEVDIHLGEISLIFEKLDLQVRKYDGGSLDDLSDLAWFGILVWAALSSTLFFFEVAGFPLCIAGPLVLTITCLGSYFSGYWTRREFEFEDDLNHLQYLVEKRFRTIDSCISDDNYRLFIQVLEKSRSLIIVDFRIGISIGDDLTLEYHMGVPSNEKERIIVKASRELLDSIFDGSIISQIISENNWCGERRDDQIGPCVIFVNESSDFSVSNRASYVTMPSIVDESSETTAQTFLDVFSRAKEHQIV